MKNRIAASLSFMSFMSLVLGVPALRPPAARAQTPTVKIAESTAPGAENIGPTYKDAPELAPSETVPQGFVYEFTLSSVDSKRYPGIAKNQTGVVPYQRKGAIYIPRQYVPGTPAPFIVAQDGMGYRGVLPKALDTLIAQKRVPVQIAILLNSGGGDAQGSERGLEYDTVSGKYAEFVEKEVLPYLTHHYDVAFTRDPEGRATMGGSSGGAAAFTMAWFHPEWFRRVLTYSGTYVNQQSPLNPQSPHGAWEYHENIIKNSKRKPIRLWMEVSENDNGADRDEASLHNWVMANERMAQVLHDKNYTYRYVFAKGAGHTDGRVTRQTLPDALEWLWQNYNAPAQKRK